MLALRRRALRRARDGQAAVRGRARAGRQGRRGARPGAAARGARRGRRARRAARAPRCSASPPSGLPGPEGQPRDVRVAGRGAAAPARGRPRGGRRWRSSRDARRDRPHPPARAARPRRGARRAASPRPARPGSTLRFDPDETRKHGLARRAGLARRRADCADDVDLCVVLGGDGTILSALRALRGHRRAGVRGELRRGRLPRHDRPRRARARTFERAFAGDFETLALPAIARRPARRRPGAAINDISVHRKPGGRVADLAYARRRARRSGACAATGSSSPRPPGSTGYNLANGGPVLAWGVEGFVVSFIAPHSLTARALVVAPDDLLIDPQRGRARSRSRSTSTGARRASCRPGEDMHVEFVREATRMLAQLPGVELLPPPAREVRPPRA